MSSKPFLIAGHQIARGERRRIQLHVAALYDYTPLSIPVEIIHGKKDGPTLFISAAIHGDEINGIEITRRILQKSALQRIKGTLMVVPIVNVFGFNSKSRYLPDGRDLNRSFPGAKSGSLAKQMAFIFMKEIVKRSTHGIDIHTGANFRYNLPQIRASIEEKETLRLSHVFGAPVIIHSKLRDGSLREASRKQNISMLLYESGEALRFDEKCIRLGVNGCMAVMKAIGMLEDDRSERRRNQKSFLSRESFWVRANKSGILNLEKKPGQRVQKGERIGVISNPFGRQIKEVLSDRAGIIIGITRSPLVNKGDALCHLAHFSDIARVSKAIDTVEWNSFT